MINLGLNFSNLEAKPLQIIFSNLEPRHNVGSALVLSYLNVCAVGLLPEFGEAVDRAQKLLARVSVLELNRNWTPFVHDVNLQQLAIPLSNWSRLLRRSF